MSRLPGPAREEPVVNVSFSTAKNNDFQWRNLYLKQFGLPTYPPPMPKNQCTTSEEYPTRADIQQYSTDANVLEHGAGAPSGTSGTSGGFDEEGSSEDPRSTESTFGGFSTTGTVGNRSLAQEVELLDEEELFTPNLFDFLIPKKKKYVHAAGDGSTVEDGSIQSQAGSPTSNSFPTFDQEEEEKINPYGLPKEILSLQHNAWTLLMDNRPLAWMEREVSLKGRSATSMRTRLLEIAVSPNPVSASWQHLGENVLEQVQQPPISEDVAASRVFESFSPYFAVISNPQTLSRLKEHHLNSRRAQQRGHLGPAADMVGFPLFSQYATWKEAWENRTAWNCAPFSFFLIYDSSYNYAHISALYMLINLIHQHSHTHSGKCLEGKGEPIALEEASHHLSQAKTVRKLVELRRNLCPLLAVQKLTEDIILAFEQSGSRTTLTMLLHVCGFLTECVLEPEVTTRFLSREALFRQAEFVVPGMNQRKDREEDDVDEYTENLTEADRIRNSMADVFSLKRFSEKELESLFDLTYWFIDAATANSRVPIDAALLPPTPQEKEKKEREEREKREREERAESDESPSSSMTISRRQLPVDLHSTRALSVSPSATHASGKESTSTKHHLVSEHLYTPGKIQVFAPVGSIVEVLILYNMRRHALHKVMLSNLAMMQQQQAKMGAGRNRRNSILPMEMSLEAGEGGDRRATNLSPATTLLSTPLILISTYVRLHGAPWLKHIFSRIFNILRRESVVLYVNRIDLEDPFGVPVEESFLENSLGSKEMDSFFMKGSSHHSNNNRFMAHMERLEDLICQDIQFVMSEFLSALHGKRSATRLPQGITTLMTQFCTTLHLHILSNMFQITDSQRIQNTGNSILVARVNEYLYALKQKQMAAKAFRTELISDYAMTRLISTIEQFRLAKFLLFDCWIIPALNNVTSFGYLSEACSTHLRWNIDAFARYLKILVNGPFTETERTNRSNDRYQLGTPGGPMSPSPSLSRPTPRGPRGGASGQSKTNPKGHSGQPKEVSKPPFTLTIPRYITGIYDVSSGSLVRLFSEVEPMGQSYADPGHSTSERHSESSGLPSLENTMRSRTFGMGGSASVLSKGHKDLLHQQSLQQSFAKNLYYRAMDDAAWEDMSSILRGLNESLGLLGYDPDEGDSSNWTSNAGGMFSEEKCSMRVLDAFCRRSSMDASTNVVVSEFEVLPSVAASCVDKIYEMMTGTHPLVEQAISAGVFPGKFSYSPYLACLNGVLLHPKVALMALDNVMQNSKRFFHVLMQPVTHQVMLDLVGSLVQNPEDLPLVDTNALTPLLTTLPTLANSNGEGGGQPGFYAAKVEAEVRKLKWQHSFLTTGCSHTTLGMKLLLNRVGPFNPYVLLSEGREIIERDIGMTPSTFDPWWRAMVLALCVKVTNVFSECCSTLSDYFQLWCHQQLDINRKESKAATSNFTKSRGGEPVVEPPTKHAGKKTRQKDVDEKGGFVVPKKTKKKKKTGGKKGKRSSLSIVQSTPPQSPTKGEPTRVPTSSDRRLSVSVGKKNSLSVSAGTQLSS